MSSSSESERLERRDRDDEVSLRDRDDEVSLSNTSWSSLTHARDRLRVPWHALHEVHSPHVAQVLVGALAVGGLVSRALGVGFVGIAKNKEWLLKNYKMSVVFS